MEIKDADIIRETPRGKIKHVLFDFDGTITPIPGEYSEMFSRGSLFKDFSPRKISEIMKPVMNRSNKAKHSMSKRRQLNRCRLLFNPP